MRHLAIIPLVMCASLFAGACRQQLQSEQPAPIAMTDEALGHYCQMALSEHPGPKAQVHLEGLDAPLFFSQVRDAIAYQRMPEQSRPIRAIYVSDMAQAPSWNDPGINNWAPAEEVHYVVGSRTAGGMGAPELVPFSDHRAAETFAKENGGSVRTLAEIPDTTVLAPVNFTLDAAEDAAREALVPAQYPDAIEVRVKP